MKAPAPNHGVAIDIGDDSQAFWVTADYDVELLASVEAIAKREITETVGSFPGLAVTSESHSRVFGLDVVDVTLERQSGVGKINYVRLWIAYRPAPKRVGIVYTIGIRQRSREARTDAAFSDLVNSFRLREVPK